MTTEQNPISNPALAVSTPAARTVVKRPRDADDGPAGPPRDSLPFKFVQIFSRIFSTLAFDMKSWGHNHVPPTGGLLLVSNHQSYLDPVLVGIRIPRSLSYMAKSELFHGNPIFAWFIRSMGAFPVRQAGSAAGAIKESVERLQAGHALNIFPEGSRTEDGQMLPIEKGIALVIRKAKVPVVPVAIEGAFEAWPKGKTMFHAHPIRLLYGPPMDLSNARADEVVRRIGEALNALYDELRAMRREGRDTPREPFGDARRG